MLTKLPPWAAGLALLTLGFMIQILVSSQLTKNDVIEKAVRDIQLATQKLEVIVQMHKQEVDGGQKRLADDVAALRLELKESADVRDKKMDAVHKKLDALGEKQQQIEMLLHQSRFYSPPR